MMLSFRRSGMTLLLAIMAGLAALATTHVAGHEAGKSGMAMMLPNDPAPLVIETANGEHRFSVEIADNDRKRAAGLMFRPTMSDDHGMLFVFEDTGYLSFWMKNTPMPLDLLFIGPDGRIVAIMPGEPYSIAPIAPQAPARFVLELKAGTADKAGIAAGDLVKHPHIDRVAGFGG